MNREECAYMVMTKTCERSHMKCVGSNCYYEPNMNESERYYWFRTNKVTYYSCEIQPTTVFAEDENKFVLGTNCYPHELQCWLKDKIMIWFNDIVNECYMEQIGETNLEHVSYNVFINKDENLLFQTKRKNTVTIH